MSCGAISLSHNHARIHHQPVGNGSRLSVPKEQYIWSILLFNISRFFQYNSFIQESLSLTLGYSLGYILHFSRCSSIHVNPCQARVRIFTKPARLKHGPRMLVFHSPLQHVFFGLLLNPTLGDAGDASGWCAMCSTSVEAKGVNTPKQVQHSRELLGSNVLGKTLKLSVYMYIYINV